MTTDVRPLGYEDGVAFCRELPHRAGVVAIPHQVFYDRRRGRAAVRAVGVLQARRGAGRGRPAPGGAQPLSRPVRRGRTRPARVPAPDRGHPEHGDGRPDVDRDHDPGQQRVAQPPPGPAERRGADRRCARRAPTGGGRAGGSRSRSRRPGSRRAAPTARRPSAARTGRACGTRPRRPRRDPSPGCRRARPAGTGSARTPTAARPSPRGSPPARRSRGAGRWLVAPGRGRPTPGGGSRRSCSSLTADGPAHGGGEPQTGPVGAGGRACQGPSYETGSGGPGQRGRPPRPRGGLAGRHDPSLGRGATGGAASAEPEEVGGRGGRGFGVVVGVGTRLADQLVEPGAVQDPVREGRAARPGRRTRPTSRRPAGGRWPRAPGCRTGGP